MLEYWSSQVNKHFGWRVGAVMGAVGAIAFVLLTISNGRFDFWWSPFSAITVVLPTLLLWIAVAGPRGVKGAVRTLAGGGDVGSVARSAACFRLAGVIALWMGALGVAIGGLGVFSVLNGDRAAIGHQIAVTGCSLLYSLFIAVPAFVAAAAVRHRAEGRRGAGPEGSAAISPAAELV